jgi:peptidoglycan/xylan/chitin deacetylase (PgdA/CDA1 family)
MSLFPRSVLPVLMYHRFLPGGGDPDLCIPADHFANQLRWLKENDFRTLSLDEAFAAWSRRSVHRRSVLLTIDDGFAADLEVAAELLLANGARAAVFVAPGLLGRQVELRHPAADLRKVSAGTIVDADGLRGWCRQGFDVGSHSLGHIDLTACDAARLAEETVESRQLLESILEREVVDFCYPYAHHDSAARRAVAEAGYRAAYAGEPPVDDIYAIPRMMVYPGDSPARFRRKVSGYYFWISALHQKLRRFVRN